MSADATGWVFKYSPLTGVEFTIHLAMADSISDMHHHRFWMKQAKLAVKARTTRQKVCTTAAKMVDMGLLRPLDDGADARKAQHRPREYRFLTPNLPLIFDVTSGDIDPETDVTSGDIAMSREATSTPLPMSREATSYEPNNNDPKSEPKTRAAFAEFWDAYAFKTGKGAAEKAWNKAIAIADPQCIVDAARARAEQDARLGYTYIANPSTWLNAKGWEDDLVARAQRSTGRSRTDQNRRVLVNSAERINQGDTFEKAFMAAGKPQQPALNEGTNR